MRRFRGVILLLIIGLAVWAGWQLRARALRSEQQLLRDHADLIARLWVGATQYREQREVYVRFRDSLLDSRGLSADSLIRWLGHLEQDAERGLLLSRQIDTLVDSLSRLVPLNDSVPEPPSPAALFDSLLDKGGIQQAGDTSLGGKSQ